MIEPFDYQKYKRDIFFFKVAESIKIILILTGILALGYAMLFI